jgi:hypothetical protein
MLKMGVMFDLERAASSVNLGRTGFARDNTNERILRNLLRLAGREGPTAFDAEEAVLRHSATR